MEFSGCERFRKNFLRASRKKSWNIKKRENSSGEEQSELNRISPNDGFDAADVSIKERESDKEQDGLQDWLTQHQLNRDARNINADACGERFADQEQNCRHLPGLRAKSASEQFIRRINLTFEIMGHQQNRENNSRDHIANDHLDKREVCAISHGRHPDDSERTGFRGND